MDLLQDSCNDRVVKDISPPPHRPLDHDLLFQSSGLPDWVVLQEHLHKEGRVSKSDLLQIVDQVRNIISQEPNLLDIKDPVVVVGDLHGQYYDMIKMLSIGGNPKDTKYLFLGDYVDRGSFSIEVILLLFSIKLNFPNHIHIIRGNHECRQMTTFFNFRNECLYKYDLEVYERIMECFDALPLSCVINRKFLAVHGGISPELRKLDDINRINRFVEPPKIGLFCDMLWSDPVDSIDGRSPDRFKQNDVRGCSFFFNVEAVNAFLKRNNLISIVRAHEAKIDGYQMHRWNGNTAFPAVITVFSAPNYCDVYNNKAAIIIFENNTLNVQQFNFTPHPYILPNFMDIFTWSMPFLIEKIAEILSCILSSRPGEITPQPDQLSEQRVSNFKAAFDEFRNDNLKNRVVFVSHVLDKYRTIREDNERLVSANTSPDDKISSEQLNTRSPLQNEQETFDQVKNIDSVNERWPQQQSD